MMPLPHADLTRTAKALEAYDALNEYAPDSPEAEAVGVAFGLDTADRNNFEVCKTLIRPGAKNPAHPDDLSFVRRMVQDFKERAENL